LYICYTYTIVYIWSKRESLQYVGPTDARVANCIYGQIVYICRLPAMNAKYAIIKKNQKTITCKKTIGTKQ